MLLEKTIKYFEYYPTWKLRLVQSIMHTKSARLKSLDTHTIFNTVLQLKAIQSIIIVNRSLEYLQVAFIYLLF